MSKYKIPQNKRVAIWTAHNYICILCGKKINWHELNIDHIIPESLLNDPENLDIILEKYGLPETFRINSLENFIPCHNHCNQSKKNICYDESAVHHYLIITLRIEQFDR